MPTPNLGLETPAHLSLPGSWDSPTNNNWGVVDKTWGGVLTVPLASSPVTISSTDAQNKIIVFTGTLGSSVTVTLPSVGSHHIVLNSTAFTNSFVVKLTCGGGTQIALPQNDPIHVVTDGTNTYFVGLERIGAYVDFGCSSVPLWITSCDVPPYLLGDGSSFSPVTYPILAGLYGGTTLPDTFGRARFNMNHGSGRLVDNLNGNTLFAGGGNEHTQSHNHGSGGGPTPTQSPHNHPYSRFTTGSGSGVNSAPTVYLIASTGDNTGDAIANITLTTFGSGSSGNMPPAYVGGITMIRAG